ncbi:MAG: hypothetical protein JNM61_15130 [Zoogloeaceae bacterium]|nr:hypothetical protein [Zoogloeaceae bacterium]
MSEDKKSHFPKVDTASLVARFPHLQVIVDEWGSASCRRRLMTLMNDTRNGERKGFPADHALTIFRLVMEHDQDFPEFEEAAGSALWSDATHDRGYWKS